MGLNLEVGIELLGYGASSATSQRTYARSAYTFDAGDYDGATYYFEIVGRNQNTSNAYNVILYDQTNSTSRATINLAASTGYGRYRSSSFTPASGSVEYRLRIDATAAANNVGVLSARIVIVQANATKTELVFPLARSLHNGTTNSETTSAAIFARGTGSATYATHDTCRRWKREDSLLSTVSGSAWSFGAIIGTNSASSSREAYASLFTSGGTQVAATEVTTASTGANYVRSSAFASDAANFANDTEYEVHIKNENASYNAYLYRAEIRVKLTSLSKAYSEKLIGGYNSATTSAEMLYQRILHDNNNWQSGYTMAFEVTGKVSATDNNNHIGICQDSNNVGSATVGSPYHNFNTQTTKGRKTTSISSLTDDYDIFAETVASTATLTVTCPIIRYYVESSGTTMTAAPTLTGLASCAATLSQNFETTAGPVLTGLVSCAATLSQDFVVAAATTLTGLVSASASITATTDTALTAAPVLTGLASCAASITNTPPAVTSTAAPTLTGLVSAEANLSNAGPIIISTRSENLQKVNSSFEQTFNNENGWSVYSSGCSNTPTYSISTTNAVHGSYAGRIQYTAHVDDTSGNIGLFGTITGVGTVSEGDMMAVGFNLRGVNSGVTVSIGARWYDSSGAYVSKSIEAKTINDTAMDRYTFVTAAAPANTSQAQINLQLQNIANGDSIDLYFDCARMEKGTTADEYEAEGLTLTGLVSASASITNGPPERTIAAASTLTGLVSAAATLSYTPPAVTSTAAPILSGLISASASVTAGPGPITCTAAPSLTGLVSGSATLSQNFVVSSATTLTGLVSAAASLYHEMDIAVSGNPTLTGLVSAAASLTYTPPAVTSTAAPVLTGLASAAASITNTPPAVTSTASPVLTGLISASASIGVGILPITITADIVLMGETDCTMSVAEPTLTCSISAAATIGVDQYSNQVTAASTLTGLASASANIVVGYEYSYPFSVTNDCGLSELNPSTKYGNSQFIVVAGQNTQADRWCTLIGVEDIVPLIPPEATITDAKIIIYNMLVADYDMGMEVRKMNVPWSELDATWNMRTSEVAWTWPGALKYPEEMTLAVSGTGATVANDPAGTSYELTGAGMISDVQGWVDAGYGFGWVIRANEPSTGEWAQFHSSESTSSQYHPVVVINYTMPEGTGSSNIDAEPVLTGLVSASADLTVAEGLPDHTMSAAATLTPVQASATLSVAEYGVSAAIVLDSRISGSASMLTSTGSGRDVSIIVGVIEQYVWYNENELENRDFTLSDGFWETEEKDDDREFVSMDSFWEYSVVETEGLF